MLACVHIFAFNQKVGGLMPKIVHVQQDIKSLRAFARELAREEQRLTVIINALQEDGINELTIGNGTLGPRGLGYVSRYIDAIREAHITALSERGDFQAEAPKSKTKKQK